MFDSIYLEVQCPYCKSKKLREVQTKDMEKELNIYHLGDKLQNPKKLDYIVGRADCDCRDDTVSGNTIFDVKINVNKDNRVGRVLAVRGCEWNEK
jgi:hypothetical protein